MIGAQDFLTVVGPLDRFNTHRTYSGAVNAVHRVFAGEGAEAAKAKVADLVELYEDLYLADAVA